METVPLENDAGCEQETSLEKKNANHHEIDSPSQSPSFTLAVDLLQNGGKKEAVNLDEFEKKQKLIEEQNRLKKQMLAKTLAMRYVKLIVLLG